MRCVVLALGLVLAGCVAGDGDGALVGGTAPAPAETGLFARLAGGPDRGAVADAVPAAYDTGDAAPRRGLGGLFGGGRRGGDPTVDVLMMPGSVGRNCDVTRRQRGRAVAQFPEDGRAIWTIYDTAPGSTQPRTQFIDGFADGCLRQVTAALMLFGAPELHETARYDPANPRAYSATDNAYETIKSRVCGVRPRSRCPADRIGRLSARTAFVTIYPRFGGTGDRVELLLDRGDLVAQADLGG